MNRSFYFIACTRMSIGAVVLFVCSELMVAQDKSSSVVMEKKHEANLINVLRFRLILKESMVAHGGAAPLRRLLERYHEEVAVPALQDAAQIAITGGSKELLGEIYRFVINCNDSADEEVGLIAASVFQMKIDDSITIVETFGTAEAVIVYKSLEFGAANLQIEGRAKKELPEALGRLRDAVLKR